MHNYVIYGVPIAAFVFLFTFAAIDFYRQARSMADRGSETKEHSERIYKDFEMYLKVTLGLVAAFGHGNILYLCDLPSRIKNTSLESH
ncbi:MAG: hypothetical protein B7X93_09980 [Hydrogenophilales bacterium 17-61-9]|nr:MAG: hypothetical protein B7X93_09980 [Hydrogenophilales bacterium 17-61-9]